MDVTHQMKHNHCYRWLSSHLPSIKVYIMQYRWLAEISVHPHPSVAIKQNVLNIFVISAVYLTMLCLNHYALLCFQPGEGQLSMVSLCSACATLAQNQIPLFLWSISISTVCGFWLVDTVSEQLFGSATVYGTMNGCNMAVKQIQKGLTGLHLISRMLKVRLKQICGKWEKHKIKYIEFHSVVS